MSKVLDVRGGASLGPIDADKLAAAGIIMPALYSLEMLFMSKEAGKKYLNQPTPDKYTSEMTMWFGLFLLQNAIMAYAAYADGHASSLVKGMGMAWPIGLAFILNRKSEGMFHDNVAIGMSIAMTALSLYVAFA